jgi:hypothetical protein
MENLATTHNGMVLCMDELGGNTDEAFSVYIRHQRWILLTETEFAEACDGTSTMAAGKLLKRLGILDCEGGKHKKRHLLGGLNLPATFFYSILTAKLLPQTEQAESLAAGPVPTTGFGTAPGAAPDDEPSRR